MSSEFKQLADSAWDVAVVGAGPAGSLAARQLAARGARVLVVDRAPMGRRKVCGCCLNIAALRTLDSVHLDELTDNLGAVPLRSLELAAYRCHSSIPLTGGVSLSRESFDAALVREAIASGANFFSDTNAVLKSTGDGFREVELTHAGQSLNISTRIVLAADGLGGKLLARNRLVPNEAEPESRIGAGVVLSHPPSWIESGKIYMACSKRGYVGLVVLEDGRLNVAAALDHIAVRQAGRPGSLAADILTEVGWPEISELRQCPLQGTMALTRSAAKLWDDRVLVLGDAAGYVEPFTGEGIAWALASAVAITPVAVQGIDDWAPEVGAQWERIHQRTVAERQSTCRVLAHALRHPWLVWAAITLLSFRPSLAEPVVRRLNAE